MIIINLGVILKNSYNFVISFVDFKNSHTVLKLKL